MTILCLTKRFKGSQGWFALLYHFVFIQNYVKFYMVGVSVPSAPLNRRPLYGC